MSTAPSSEMTGVTSPAGPEPDQAPPRRSKRRVLLAGGAAVVLAAAGGAAAGAYGLFGNPNPPASGVTDNAAPTSLATVTQGTLTSQSSVSATLTYAGQYTVLNHAVGAYSALPPVGQIVRRGEDLYWVSGSPVVLLYGPIPAYRTLQQGLSGTDVRQLKLNLIALGYATRAELHPSSDYYNAATATAMDKFQKHLGVTQTGTLPLGQAVFLPRAARITSVMATLGASAGPAPVMQATSTRREVTIALDAAQQSEVKVGDKVTITLPNNQTTPGVVSYVGTVATKPSAGAADTNPTITVDVTPTHPRATGSLDQAPVQVAITSASVHNALIVPVNALLALAGQGDGEAGGGYAVEVREPGGGHRLRPVTVGLFDDADGTVQVSGPGLRAGQSVVVPSS
jgi:peptidoglycan hydrolase-like protein with peptidoglycan-binding domain